MFLKNLEFHSIKKKARKALKRRPIPARRTLGSYSYTYLDSDEQLANEVWAIEEYGTYEQKKYLEFGLF